MKNKNPILFFDGVCNLCNTSVQFIIKRDKKKVFLFASLQSDVAKNILLHKKYKINMDTIVLFYKDKIYTKSDAALLIFRLLGFPYNILFPLIIIPRIIRNFVYDLIAKNRYKWFGKKDFCMIPKQKYLERFIDH
jgi:predicted DCC family thiol-disulfide oxidoreductase YuxK